MNKIYVAGKLFKKADINARVEEETRLKELGFTDIFNPITQPFNEDKSSALPTAKTIFSGDTKAVIESDIIIAELDDEDPGVCMELGVAYGINYMLDLISKAQNGSYEKKDKNSLTAIDDILKTVKKKEIYAHLTDIRVDSSGEYNGLYVPFGVNQYVVGGIEEIGNIFTDKEDMYESLKEDYIK